MKRFWIFFVGCAALVTGVLWRPHAAPQAVYESPDDRDYTSSREIDRLEVAPDGTVWALTGGGVLRLQDGAWKKYLVAPRDFHATQKSAVRWRGQTVTTTFDRLQIGARCVAMPPSGGTHISAVWPRGKRLWAALFGDGIWEWNGQTWTRPRLNLPPEAREITALAGSPNGETMWVGTRRQGLWRFQNGAWKQYLQPDEPFAHNVQFLQSFRRTLWASTLEDGLVVRDAKGWKHFGKGFLSSNAPRQMAVFQDRLYVRHSNEVVDCYDGKAWAKNVFPALPRKQIISLAADDKRLYLGQWGGWSEWDGNAFTHHLRIPELQIVPLLQIFPDSTSSSGKRLWLGTENRGLFEWDVQRQSVRLHDERDGLPDDWVTSLNRNGLTLLAGTFNGGLAWRDDHERKWHSAPDTNRLGITAIVADGARRTWIATRFGLLRRDEKGTLHPCEAKLASSQREIQSLLPTAGGLWMGTRNGLLFRTRLTLDGIGTKSG